MAEYKPTSSEESSTEDNIESQKVKNKVNKGCLLGCFGSSFLAIIASIFVIPMFNGVQQRAKISYAQNTLVNIVKECIIRSSQDLSTNFIDIKLIGEYNKNSNIYVIESLEGDSCFQVIANLKYGSEYQKKYLIESGYTNFAIIYSPESNLIFKSCEDPSKYGCTKRASTYIWGGDWIWPWSNGYR